MLLKVRYYNEFLCKTSHQLEIKFLTALYLILDTSETELQRMKHHMTVRHNHNFVRYFKAREFVT